ncbi:major facilitator superfamily domain-containing protein [Penicillium macrosclerotiorum]|uniref:major facilitator superfamily domain-containing protein n=1 Tax=Penicillium macrosclerotiorum TaxID=303699 RepID=UPI0025499388|nr:major facilitator superfamily domain-containing protein [Penicillium macrosclerotiorum]KAJ5679157.1 major facilitator superfamily domain-containing protein [Penicillium macrosclerotiorum]
MDIKCEKNQESHLRTDPRIQRHIRVDDWNGPNDPDNPRNFPLATRLWGQVSVTCLAFASAFAGSIYAPASDEIMRVFNCSYEVSVLPLALYNLGMAFGPLLGAPLSETYGRKAVFIITTPISMAFMVGAGAASNLRDIIICRFFAAILASPNISNASATILDYTPEIYRGVYLGVYYSIPSVAPTLGPLAGGFVLQTRSWRWTQWVAIFVSVATYIPVLFTKETYKGVILKRRARRLGLSDDSSQKSSFQKTLRYFFVTLIQRPLHMLFTEPIVTLVSSYNGVIFGLLYAYVVSIPWTLERYYEFDSSGQSLSYLGVSLGSLLACIPFSFIDIFYYQRRLHAWKSTPNSSERFPPENRLLSAMVASPFLPACLFIAGWTAEYKVHWIVPIFFQGMTMLACLLVYAGVNLFMLDSYGPLYGASASGAMMFSRYLMSFIFPLFALQMFELLDVGWATSLLAFLMLLMAPIPWAFWVYGERLRIRSRYESSS